MISLRQIAHAVVLWFTGTWILEDKKSIEQQRPAQEDCQHQCAYSQRDHVHANDQQK